MTSPTALCFGPANPPTRPCAIASARSWIGTPYHHQASLRGVGTDCLGLIRGIYRDLYGCETETPPPYTRDWAETTGEEALFEAACRHLIERQGTAAQPGDILLFRLRPGLPAKHVALLATPQTFVHAMEGGPVTEVPFSPWWHRRTAAVFSFPGMMT